MNIFVTGATGFIGRAILSQLQNRNYNIMASSLEDNYDADKNENVKWLIADLNDINNIKDDLKIALTPTVKSQAAPLLCGIEIIAEGW